MILDLLVSIALADVHDVEAKPSAVVVFADRARVTRTATLNLSAGRQEVVFTGLPTGTMAEGLTADARGQAVLRGIDIRQVTASEIADQRVKVIESELEKLQDQRQTALDEATVAQQRVQSLTVARQQSASQLSAQMMYGERAPQQAAALRTSLSSEEAAAREAWRAADQRRRDLDERIGSLVRERDTLGSSATDTFEAIVHLDVSASSRVEVDLNYLVSGASWTPRYDVRGDTDTGKVDVALSAMVQQATGEDWRDVRLTVSSARPSLGAVVPELDPFWLQRPQYYPKPSAGAVPAAPSRSSKAAEAPAAKDEAYYEPEPMEVAQAQVSVELAATSFTTARPEDVPADGTERKVLLTTQSLDAKLRHVVVPRLDPRAYVVGEVVNTAEFPLLAGTAGVFLAGAYLGDMQLETVPPGEKFDVAFGIDDAVTVKRVPRSIQEGKTGIVGKRATSRWAWDVRIKNGRKRAIDVVVHEQIPVSTQDEVKVTLLPSTPEPKVEDGGLLKFRVDVAAGAEKTVSWGYAVEYPSDVSLGWLE